MTSSTGCRVTQVRADRRLRVAATLFAVSLLGVATSGCRTTAPETRELTVAAPALEQSALLYIADERGYFEDNGLKVTIRDELSGPPAIAALLNGEARIAEAAEFPVARSILLGESLHVIATDDRFQNDYLIARRDRGIEKIEDLKGKRIGVTRGAITEFYLSRFLELRGVALDEVQMVDVAPNDFPRALSSGEVDALIAWQPYVDRIRRDVRDVVVWPAQNDQAAYSVLVCDSDWLSRNRDTTELFLKALARAEDDLQSDPESAREIVRARLGYDDTYLRTVWPEHLFGLSLDFALIAAMDDEANWMAANGLAEPGTPVDFRDHVYTDSLRGVRPGAVGIGD